MILSSISPIFAIWYHIRNWWASDQISLSNENLWRMGSRIDVFSLQKFIHPNIKIINFLTRERFSQGESKRTGTIKHNNEKKNKDNWLRYVAQKKSMLHIEKAQQPQFHFLASLAWDPDRTRATRMVRKTHPDTHIWCSPRFTIHMLAIKDMFLRQGS